MPTYDKKAGTFSLFLIYAPSPYINNTGLDEYDIVVNHECNESQVSPSQVEQISFSSYIFVLLLSGSKPSSHERRA